MLAEFKLIALLLIAWTSFNQVAASTGIVTLDSDVDFGGDTFTLRVAKSQLCYDILCFDNKAAFVKWSSLPSSADIAFYAGPSCTGTHTVWATDHQNQDKFPSAVLKNLYHEVTSVIVWEANNVTSDYARVYCS